MAMVGSVGVCDADFVAALGGCTPIVTLGFLSRAPHSVKLLERDGRISNMSEAGCRARAIADPADVIGRPWWDLWPPDDRPPLRDAVTRAGLGETVTLYLRRALGKASLAAGGYGGVTDGAQSQGEITITPVRDSEGRVVRLLAVSRGVAAQQTAGPGIA